MKFNYRDAILVELARHGVCPTADTPPALIREFVNDLYCYEVRALRGSLLRGNFPKREYAGKVSQLRDRYPVLGIPVEHWVSKEDA